MRFKTLYLAVVVASVSFAQKTDRTFAFTNKPSVTGMQEILTVLRTVAHLQYVSGDPVASSVAVSGSTGDIVLAEWMINALDQPTVPDATSKQIRDSAVHEFRVPGAKDDLVRMFYLSNMDSPMSTQELITVLRTVGRIKYVFNYTPLHALAIRATTDEIALSAWIINELDQPPSVQTEGIHQFHSSDPNFPVVRAFYLTHRTQRDIQETLTSLRTTAHIQRAFSHTARAVIIIAGTPAEVEESSRLVAEKDRAVAKATP